MKSTEQPGLAIVCFTDVRDLKLQVQIQTKNFLEEANSLSLRFFFPQRGYESVYITNYTSHYVLRT